MTNYGYVSSVSTGFATVEISRNSACAMMHENDTGSSCSGHCEGCASMLHKMTIKADNAVGAAVGDRVEIESESKSVLLLSALVFVIPLLVLVAVYFFTRNYFEERTAIIFGLLSFCLCYVILRLLDKKLASLSSCKIRRIISKYDPSEEK